MARIEKIGIDFVKSPYFLLLLIISIAAPSFFLRGIGIFDDSVYLKMGELITEGVKPYLDVFDNKPPGIYYLAALLHAVGAGWLGIRFFLFIFAIAVGCLVVRYVQVNWGKSASYHVAYLFGFSYILSQGFSFLTEQFCAFAGFLAILSVSGLLARNYSNWFIAGVWIGVAFLFKQVAVAYLLGFAVGLVILFLTKKLDLPSTLSRIIFLFIGFSTVCLIVGYFLFTNGLWQSFYDSVFISLKGFSQRQNNLSSIIGVWIKIPIIVLIPILSCILVANQTVRTAITKSQNYADLLFLAIGGLIAVLPTIRIATHHYAGTATIALSIPEAVIISQLLQYSAKNQLELFNRNISKKLLITALSVCLIPALMSLVGLSSIMAIQNRFSWDVKQAEEIKSIFNQCAPPNARLLVLSGTAPRLNYMTGRLPFTKYIYFLWNTKMSLSEAKRLLITEDVPLALLEEDVDARTLETSSDLNKNVLSRKYMISTLKTPNPPHQKHNKTWVLINRKFEKNCSLN